MSTPVLATKLYVPAHRPQTILRPRLLARLDQGLHGKLTLLSAPAGFGKTTLVAEWSAGCGRPVAWLSLDETDDDPARFLLCLVASLQTAAPGVGQSLLPALQAPQPPPPATVLATLLNDLTALRRPFLLVLDDYHLLKARSVQQAVTFLLEHLPPLAHLVIATREDPRLPLPRLRARGQLNELRADDLRFTTDEASQFFADVMGLDLSSSAIAKLESRTEGWIAGLQLAALALQGHTAAQGEQDTAGFIRSFTGSHRFVLDYLLQEILLQQPQSVQEFLLHTSILDRLCGSLCEALLDAPPGSGQETLAALERANLFTTPLDGERRWYRYHHLFGEMLRQLLRQTLAGSPPGAAEGVRRLHLRASRWYEDNNLPLEAFRHAAAAGDVARAERLITGKGIPLHFRGAVTTILDWLASLPPSAFHARPSLWWRHASLLLVNGQTTGVEEKLDAAEAALSRAGNGSAAGTDGDHAERRELAGKIAAARAVLALTRYQPETMVRESRRALDLLPPQSLSLRANAYWTLGIAHLYVGERAAARSALVEGVALSQASGAIFTTILATIGLGNVQEGDNELYQAAETYRRVLQLTGDQPLQIIYEAHLGLARILYEWNDLDAAEQHARQGLQLARQYDRVVDRFVLCELFLARLRLARGDVAGAATLTAQAEEAVRRRNFVHRLGDLAAMQVLLALRQDELAAAVHLAARHGPPLSRARVHLAREDAAAALSVLASYRQQAAASGWQDERLRAIVLQTLAHQAQGDLDRALALLGEALALAEAQRFTRLFIDEGPPMARLLREAAGRGLAPHETARLLAVLDAERRLAPPDAPSAAQPLLEPLSRRELEVLRLVAQGLSNQEIGDRLFLALNTVKGHNRKIFQKLHVQRRTEAVARARELGLL